MVNELASINRAHGARYTDFSFDGTYMLSRRSPFLTALSAELIVGVCLCGSRARVPHAGFRGVCLERGLSSLDSQRQRGRGRGRRNDSLALRGARMAAPQSVTRRFGQAEIGEPPISPPSLSPCFYRGDEQSEFKFLCELYYRHDIW